MKKYLETGKIVGTHGLKGELRVQPWCDSAEFLCGFKTLYLDENGENSVKVVRSRAHKNIVIMQLKGVDTIEAAEQLREKIVYISRKDVKLPKGSYFIQDLIGLKVYDADTEKYYGTLSEVSATGANDVYHILGENGKETLIAAVPSVVIETNITDGIMKIRPLEGTFEDED